MELVENITVNAGLWAFLPALTAIITAFFLRDVIASLLTGIAVGALVYAAALHTGLRGFLGLLFGTIFTSVIDNISLITFILILGALVSVITMSGGHLAYGRWIAEKIKTTRGVSLATVILGILIFIDDYFSCLLVGSVMGPIAEKHKISREKLAYFIDSTAGPVCILAPLSSWSPTITATVEGAGIHSGLLTFIASIPFNFYAIFVLIFAVYIALFHQDFSLMRLYERRRIHRGEAKITLYKTERDISEAEVSERGRVIDLIAPNAAVILLTLCAILWLGGYFGPEKPSIVEAYAAADTTLAINYACLGALALCFLMYIPRKLLTKGQFFEGAVEGMKSMFVANLILVMAWSLSSIVVEALGAGAFVETLMREAGEKLNLSFLPLVIFVISAAAALGLGSWGTFMMTIPFIAIIAKASDPTLFPLFLGATLAGAVFGDHASPITDTTTLASISAKCNQIEHVKTQLPYALLLCFGSAGAFTVMGFTRNLAASGAAGAILVIGALFLIYRKEQGKYGERTGA